MELLQTVLVYLVLALAVGFLVRKFFWPKRRMVGNKGHGKDCEGDNCGCQ